MSYKEERKMLKAVIFDMDGLMVDTEIISYLCYKKIIESYGYTFSKEEYIERYPGKTLVHSLNYIKDYYHIDFDVNEKILEFRRYDYELIDQGVQLKKGLITLLKYLKTQHYKTIIATSSTKERAMKMLSQFDILRYFDDMICGNEVTQGKPSPEIFLKACEKINVLPEEALVLEDSEAGIEAAYNGNIDVICIPDLKMPNDYHILMCNKVLSSLEEVIEYIPQRA